MKKSKMLLPMLAFLFAIASSFASKPLAQMAWYHVPPNSSAEGEITNTVKECATGRTVQCLIGTQFAYNSATAANTQNSAGLLKYNP